MITKIYCGIHLDYVRLRFEHRKNDDPILLDGEVYWKYHHMTNAQNSLMAKIANDPEAALLIILPYVNEYNSAELEWKAEYIANYLIGFKKFSEKLGNRFAFIDGESFVMAANGKMNREDVLKQLPFEYSEDSTLITFGQYIELCVKVYGESLTKVLGIQPDNFVTLHEISWSCFEKFQ